MEKYLPSSIIQRLYQEHIKNYITKILAATFFMIVVAGCNAMHIQIIAPAIDEVFSKRNQEKLWIISGVILCISFAKGISEYCQSYIIRQVGQRILTDIQIKLYEHLLRSDLSTIVSYSSSKLISRFTNDISLMRSAVSNLLTGIVKHLLSIIFLIGVMFYMEPRLSTFAFVVFPCAIYPINLIGKKIRSITYSTQEELSNYTLKLDENFSGIRVIKSYINEEHEIKRANNLIEKIFHLYKKTAKFDALSSPIIEILSGIATSGIFLYGGYLVINEKTTTGSLLAFITAFISAYRPFKSLVQLNTNMQEVLTASKRVFQVFDTKPKIIDSDNAEELKQAKGKIEFSNICLEFENQIALKNLNFTIKERTTTAIVGRSGSGKTSIANLLVRFYDPEQGIIKIDDKDIKEYTIESLRKNIALVTQDIVLFDATIEENIAYGKVGATREEVILAAKNAFADEFIDKLPFGYDTPIGVFGSKLSGGQKQRISLARAFLKNAPILILDEATSALDSHSEAKVKEAINNLRKNKTTIIIAHKLSSIQDADKILVLKEGIIIEQGNHNDLIKLNSEYSDLYNYQKKFMNKLEA